jgi:hypothetical protein
MEIILVSVIIGLWLLLIVPMALVALLPDPHERTDRAGAPLFRMGGQRTTGRMNGHRPAA